MKLRLLLSALLLTGTAQALNAQAMVVQPEPALDAARAGVRDTLLVLRDSLHAVHAAGAHLRRDFRGASGETLLSRARAMLAACAASTRSMPAARSAVKNGPAATERARVARERLLAAMDQLAEPLATCETRFAAWAGTADGESVRGYGNRRADEIRDAIRAFENDLTRYFSAQGIRVRPVGAGSAIRS